MKYAIVDIETTGGSPDYSAITEVAIFIHDGKQIIDSYETLINPNRVIPRYITGLTGIDNHLVEDAPAFEDVAGKIHSMLHDCIFVAHNVGFDYSFIKQGLEWHGYEFNLKKLCTVRLGRKIFPGLKSYSLGNLCNWAGIQIQNRHRAGGDAEATVKLFEKMLQEDKENYIETYLKRNSKEQLLPPNLPKIQFTCLPDVTGVYYFHDQKGKVIYVGKAKNIKSRIASHFNGKSKATRLSFMEQIHSISYEECGNELTALLFESHEIKRLWPVYNSSQKRPEIKYIVSQYEDQLGYHRLAINKASKNVKEALNFRTFIEARNFLESLVEENSLCPKLSGLQESNGACFEVNKKNCAGACIQDEAHETYNLRVREALEANSDTKSFAILGKGRKNGESSVILVEQGTYLGFGFVSGEEQIQSPEDFKNHIRPCKDTHDSRQIIYSWLNRDHEEKVLFY